MPIAKKSKTLIPAEPVEVPKVKIIRDKAFGQRLELAADGNALVPPYNRGRLTWVKAQMQGRFGESVSVETVRKWFGGEVKPRPDKLKLLAEMFEVDEGWLSLGIAPDLEPREQRLRNAVADGAVNLLAGVIQMNGGNPAFPEPGDKRAAKGHIDLYAIIKGAQYAFHINLAQAAGPKTWKFVLPTNWEDAFQIGVIHEDSLRFQFVELTDGLIATGSRKGGAIEVTATLADLKRITSFRERL